MDSPVSVHQPPEALRERVCEVIRKHWVKPSPGQRLLVPRDQVDAVARKVLDTMLTRQYRVGPLPPPEIYEQLLERVRLKVRKGQRIRVVIGYGPLKNQNAVSYSRADWAEFFALCHLVSWHNKVQAVYPPGMEFRIIFDDSTLSMANRADKRLMKSYMASLPELTRALGYESLFLRPNRQSYLSWLFHFGLYQLAWWRVRQWERDPANQQQLDRMVEYARRNVVVPPGLKPDEQEAFIRRASHRYRVYWEALQLSGATNWRFRIVAMYLDGTQHHIRQQVALHLTTLDKGQITQPWQGEGALLDNGHGKLEPFVLTAGRRKTHRLETIEGLNLIPMPGFERISIATKASDES